MSGAAPAGGAAVRCVVFRAGGERFALPLEAVREVVLPQPPFARVPRSGRAVRGAMNLRGRVVPIVDLAILLGLATPAPAAADAQVLVLEGARPGLGLLIAGVIGVEPLVPERDGAPGGAARPACASRTGPATLLDPAALAREAESHFGARPHRTFP